MLRVSRTRNRSRTGWKRRWNKEENGGVDPGIPGKAAQLRRMPLPSGVGQPWEVAQPEAWTALDGFFLAALDLDMGGAGEAMAVPLPPRILIPAPFLPSITPWLHGSMADRYRTRFAGMHSLAMRWGRQPGRRLGYRRRIGERGTQSKRRAFFKINMTESGASSVTD